MKLGKTQADLNVQARPLTDFTTQAYLLANIIWFNTETGGNSVGNRHVVICCKDESSTITESQKKLDEIAQQHMLNITTQSLNKCLESLRSANIEDNLPKSRLDVINNLVEMIQPGEHVVMEDNSYGHPFGAGTGGGAITLELCKSKENGEVTVKIIKCPAKTMTKYALNGAMGNEDDRGQVFMNVTYFANSNHRAQLSEEIRNGKAWMRGTIRLNTHEILTGQDWQQLPVLIKGNVMTVAITQRIHGMYN